MSEAEEGRKKAGGRPLRAPSRPFLAARLPSALDSDWLGTAMSSSRTCTPALAKWAAMRAPMVPAPKTATRRMNVMAIAILPCLGGGLGRGYSWPGGYGFGLATEGDGLSYKWW